MVGKVEPIRKNAVFVLICLIGLSAVALVLVEYRTNIEKSSWERSNQFGGYNLTKALSTMLTYNGTAYKLNITIATHYSVETPNIYQMGFDYSIQEITNQTIQIPLYDKSPTIINYWAKEGNRYVLIKTEAVTK